MCGRFVVAREADDLAGLFDAELPEPFETISYNYAPTQLVPILVEREINSTPVREIHPARFGLIPSWAKEIPATPLFNARIESVLEKPSFQESALKKRCVVPATGYFEWDQDKQPLFLHQDPIVCFAGIYSFWRDPSKQATDPSRWVLSVSILTKSASPKLSFIHDRSPVMLSEDGLEAWLAPDYETNQELLEALSLESDEVAAGLEYFKVSKDVGKVSNNHPGLIQELSF